MPKPGAALLRREFSGGSMRRRDFIAVVGGAAVTWPLVASAQQPMPVIGFLNVAAPDGYALYVAAFRDGLKESGYVEGQNVAIEYRWAEGQYDRIPDMAADLVRRQVSVIVANTPANLVAKKATDTIPIVFTTASDPVQLGLVPNLSRPGGNVTGISQLNVEIGPKRLELARELMPAATAVAFLVNPGDVSRAETLTKDAQAAAGPLGLRLEVLRAGTDAEIAAAFAGFAELKAGVLVIGADALFNSKSQLLAELSLRYKVPAIYQYGEFTDAGGLISYGGSIKESYRWAGVYAGRILKGVKPADLPVQQSIKVELIVNLKTAKALGVNVPLALLGRADQVIE
jgi:putative tryptophan/tyrosine transport system substrate-binding protein